MRVKNEKIAGVVLTYFNLAIGFVIPILYTPLMLRMLGQAEYGLLGLSSSVTSYLSLLTLGLGSALVRYLMRYRVANDERGFNSMAGLFLFVYSIIAIVTIACGVLLTRFTGVFFGKGLTDAEIQKMNILLIIMSTNTAISFVISVYTSFVTCFEKYFFMKMLALISTVAMPCLNLVVLYFGMASVGMAIASLVLQCIFGVIYAWYSSTILNIHPTFKSMPFAQLKDIFKYSAFVLIGMIADLLYWATDKVLIGATLGTVAVAIYNVGSTFQGVLQNMAHAISNVFSPQVNRVVIEGDAGDASDLLIRIGRLQYLIVSLILSGFAVFGDTFVNLWAGDGYHEAYIVASLTMYPLAIPLIQSIAFAVISAKGMHRFRSVLYAVLAVANAITTYFLIPIMGIVGAALCTCVVFTLGHGVIMNWYYYKKVGLDILVFWKNILKMSIVPVILSTIFILIDFKIENMQVFLFGVVVYTILFAVLTWLFTMNRYEKNLLLGFLKRSSNK